VLLLLVVVSAEYRIWRQDADLNGRGVTDGNGKWAKRRAWRPPFQTGGDSTKVPGDGLDSVLLGIAEAHMLVGKSGHGFKEGSVFALYALLNLYSDGSPVSSAPRLPEATLGMRVEGKTIRDIPHNTCDWGGTLSWLFSHVADIHSPLSDSDSSDSDSEDSSDSDSEAGEAAGWAQGTVRSEA
jgi:hypothetical protein